METVYIETTIPSFLTSRPSTNPDLAYKQQITTTWWNRHRLTYRLVTSQQTTQEAAAGHPEAAARRLTVLEDIEQLTTPIALMNQLAQSLFTLLQIPSHAALDAEHLAHCILNRCDYLLTWNCAHLANPRHQDQLRRYCLSNALFCPVLCTPEDLLPKP